MGRIKEFLLPEEAYKEYIELIFSEYGDKPTINEIKVQAESLVKLMRVMKIQAQSKQKEEKK